MKFAFLSLLALASTAAHADEYYEFYRVQCVSAIPSLEIEHVAYWSIGDVVWPELDWKKHVASLKKLELDDGLYVFDQMYGYADGRDLTFQCGAFRASIDYAIAHREEGPLGGGEPVRMNARVTIVSGNHEVVSEMPLASVKKLKLYVDSDKSTNIYACTTDGCRTGLFESFGVLTPDNVKQLPSQ